ncbi:YihY/virulence factor BrkB family protein [Methylobacterium radiotolerans]|uniref:YihY/virulence factor BrkB family protein n=1 Tax=Methylobacterium TaxID=407 RepID=UPI0005E14E31|nr:MULTISPECIES: YihY/virulence factor BrkB family protein [Methylobacterium]MBN6820394.1 YihY/virulence factor BrkB family protein [Methylobacterium organophilum]OXE39093.1 YihY/virulence factor BrkB family protein [Methylobacterium radiotolerans]GAN50410.1 ribonuclease BN [Methylobacterium sp. ME121]
MPAPDPAPARAAAPEGGASTVWTLALATALIGLVALPRRPARGAVGTAADSPVDSSAGSSADRAPGRSADRDDARRTSPAHAGREAHAVARAEADRGRRASTPTEIPAKGWKDIALRAYHDIGENRLSLIAAGVTFFTLLAIFPAVAALVSCYGLVADASTINDQLASLQGILPQGALEIVGDQVKRLNEQGNTTLGFSLLISIALSVWSANGGVKHVFDALNLVYNEREKRNFLVLNLVSLAFTAGALLFLLLALAAVVVVPVVLEFVGLGADAWWLALLRWPVLLVAVLLGLALLYRYGPSRDAPRWRWVTPGGALAALLWIVASLLFSWYVAHFGSYNKTYGSLGAAIGFMTWIWLSTMIVLTGAQVNAEMEHQTAEDTTVGAPQPLGTRRARMADTVGAAAE